MCSPSADALDLGQILLLDPEARMHQGVREVAVVREQQEAFACPGRAGRPGTRGSSPGGNPRMSGLPWGSRIVVTTPGACAGRSTSRWGRG